MKRALHILIATAFVSTSASAQWSVSALGPTADTITFDQTFSDVNNGPFAGDGFDAVPAVGLLDSDAWKVTGLSDGSSSFSGTATTGDFARGGSAGGVTGGGVYAFEVASGDTALGIQPIASDWTPGDLILRVINNTGGIVDSVYIGYDFYTLNNEDRSNSFHLSYAVNDSASFTNLSALNDTSIAAASGTPAWVATSKAALFPATIGDGDTLYLVWTGDDVGGSGSRDEFALDNIVVEFYTETIIPPGPPTYPISTINTEGANGVADSLGVECFVQGVVIGIDHDENVGYNFTIWDNGGINIFSSVDVDNYIVDEGDSILVRGTIDQFNGLTRLSVDSIYLINSGNSIPSPSVVTSLNESTESELIRIDNFWVGTISGPLHTLTNGSNSVVMQIDSATDIPGNVEFNLGDTICYVIGIGSQFDNSNPFTEGYEFFPQRASDIDNNCGSIPPPTIPFYPIPVINTDDANGEPDSMGVYCWTKGVVLGVDLDGNAGLSFTLWDEGGISVFNDNDISNYTVAEGDSLMVRGQVDLYNGLTELVVDSIQLLNSSNPTPNPSLVSTPSQSTESELIRIDHVTIIDTAQWPSLGDSLSNVNLLTCQGDTIVMVIDTDTEIDEGWPSAPLGQFHLIGIGGQFDAIAPYLENYQIFPMYPSDIDTFPVLEAPSLVINELMSENGSAAQDENGDFDDWIELYNTGTSAVSLSGLFITNDPNDIMKYPFPAGTTSSVAAGGYGMVWADNESDEGDLHTNFTLSASGGFVGLSYMAGCDAQLIDDVSYVALAEDESYGRESDGGSPWVVFEMSTPNATNAYLSVSEITNADLKAWPNPNNGGSLFFSSTISFQMYNLTGQVVASGRNVSQIDLSLLESGIYMIETNRGEVFKVVKK